MVEFSPSFLTNLVTSILLLLSIEAVGSSKMMTGGLLNNARNSHTTCRCPPDSLEPFFPTVSFIFNLNISYTSGISNFFINVSTSSGGTFLLTA